jgi:rubrerythrin
MQTFSLNEVIEMAVQIERSGYTYYNSALERKDLTPESRKLLEKLRDQEINHEKTFLALRNQKRRSLP